VVRQLFNCGLVMSSAAIAPTEPQFAADDHRVYLYQVPALRFQTSLGSRRLARQIERRAFAKQLIELPQIVET
jgi:hypothetical protein